MAPGVEVRALAARDNSGHLSPLHILAQVCYSTAFSIQYFLWDFGVKSLEVLKFCSRVSQSGCSKSGSMVSGFLACSKL